MNKEELAEQYPLTFSLIADKDIPVYHTICLADGWLKLVEKMSNELSEQFPDIRYRQVKEKFGKLRVYYTGHTEENRREVNFIVDKYEYMSRDVCETCGGPGLSRGGSWLRVLCDEHNVNNQPVKDSRIRWTPDSHDRTHKGILLEHLGDGHLANVIRFMKEENGYGDYHIYLFETEANRRGLSESFLNTEHPHNDEYELEYVHKNNFKR